MLVELKARFDEESNIEWARALEREGVHVVYGLVGLKIHSKVALVVRREGDRIRRYVHLATGNYNAVTAHLYTDIGMFTAIEEIGRRRHRSVQLPDRLLGQSGLSERLLVAPVNLRAAPGRPDRARDRARSGTGETGHLIFKMNALVDPSMIRLLYRGLARRRRNSTCWSAVSAACGPGLPGVSDNIRVTSIVGRFLEHSRIYYFRNGGEEEVYLGSADLMPRNLDRRVEVLFPLEDRRLVAACATASWKSI